MAESKIIHLFGASGHGKVVLDIAESLGLEVAGLIDDDPTLENVLGYVVIHEVPDKKPMVITVGKNSIRKRLAEKFSDRDFPVLVHPDASVSKYTEFGEGTVVMRGASINADVVVGNHCIINTNASVDHDCKIANFVHISPNAALGGDVHIGEGTHLGIGACVIQGIRIGKWCTIGAGAVIIRDVPDHSVVVGNPGKIIRKTHTSDYD